MEILSTPLTLFLVICLSVGISSTSVQGAGIEDECSVDKNCSAAWSVCDKGICKCIDQFEHNNDGVCRPIEFYCPNLVYSNRKERQKPGKLCTLRISEAGVFHNCPSGQFCFPHTNMFTKSGERFGHCCPNPPPEDGFLEPSCPLTTIFEAKCVRSDKDNKPRTKDQCQERTHKCISPPFRELSTINDNEDDEILSCCPIPCRGDKTDIAIADTGKCFPKRTAPNDPCIYQAQCPENTFCTSNGKDQFTCHFENLDRQANAKKL